MSLPDFATPFDYVVVGGGTAGLTVASRLTEDQSIRVLVIEAGPDNSNDPLVLTPGLVGAQFGNDKYDWNFFSVPQPALHDRCISQPRGRQLGGSSALNYMVIMYPSRAIMDGWGKLGNPGWSFDAIAPYYQKSSTSHTPGPSARAVTGLEAYHDDSLSGAGPLQVSFSEEYTDTFQGAWIKSFENLGLKTTADPRTGKSFGSFQNPASIDPATKTGSCAASAYYSADVRARKNLVILTETLAKKIATEKKGDEVIATDVVIQTKDGVEKTVTAQSEVILAAGALQSPQILELSGIGARKLLESHDIPVVINNAGVGEHLQDHAIACQSFEVADGVPSADAFRDKSLLDAVIQMYMSGQGGPLGMSPLVNTYAPLFDSTGLVSVQAKKELVDKYLETQPGLEFDFLRSIVEATHEPTAQYLFLPFQLNVPPTAKHLGDYIAPVHPENYITVVTALNHPFSRGSVHITSADIKTKPAWNPNYMSHPLDIEMLARHVQFVEKFLGTAPFSAILKPNGKRLPPIKGDDLEGAKEIVRQHQISIFHPSGSLPMLPREQGGVVNERLIVHGTKNLRVVDASIFPLQTLGTIQATVYAVAERAADFIKEDARK